MDVQNGLVPNLTIDGLQRPVGALKCLFATNGGGAANTRSSAREMGSRSGAGYQVPVGKTFKIVAIKVIAKTAANVGMTVCQTDADIGLGVNTAFTNPIFAGTESASADYLIQTPAASVGSEGDLAIVATVGAGKFVGVQIGDVGVGYVWGYEA